MGEVECRNTSLRGEGPARAPEGGGEGALRGVECFKELELLPPVPAMAARCGGKWAALLRRRRGAEGKAAAARRPDGVRLESCGFVRLEACGFVRLEACGRRQAQPGCLAAAKEQIGRPARGGRFGSLPGCCFV